MDFGTALERLKNGDKLARASWGDAFIFLVPGSTFHVNRPPLLGIYPEGTQINYHSHIDIRTASGEIMPWVPSQGDLLAMDWGLA